MYSKPLASRMDGMRETPTKAKRSAPLGGVGAINFASFLPQNTVQTPALPGVPTGKNAGQGVSPMEQAATQNNFGLNQMRALAALNAAGQSAGANAQADDLQQGVGLPLNPRDLFKLLTKKSPDIEDASTAVRVKSHRKNDNAKDRIAESVSDKVGSALAALRQKTAATPVTESGVEVGKLAAKFESGSDGGAAIGYDRHGGTSYGKYQISSRAGTMRSFIGFLKTEAPDIAERLEKAGPMNTGGKRGKMPETWKQIAAEDPDRFEALQDKFIRASHFEPAMRAISEKSGVPVEDMPFALREVVFSTAVQHGASAASRIISRALGQVGETKLDPEKNPPESLAKAQENLIRKIYDNRSGQFRSSTQTVQAAVKSRLKQEMSMAISMLRQEHVGA
ncbi:hypothetical protein LJC26_07850 [Desulfovibrio sp. OttesenSCG-928-O18]|nr:hypothetical protein [Desulfovibrio sp. OttesenSCG-928-O18]